VTKFFKRVPVEAWPGIALIAATTLAMLVVNSDLNTYHQGLLSQKAVIGFGEASISMSLSSWVKNALMAIFFFYAGIELKRELLDGALASLGKAALPLAAALGGMALPALIYLLIAGTGVYKAGWAIPAATDIAFALGVLALLGPRVPATLKAFLLAVAVIDDLGAILIVAFVYTDTISWLALGWAGLFFSVLVAMNLMGIRALGLYALASLPLWAAMQASGINPTVAGVLAAATIPLRDRTGDSPLLHAEHALQPYVLFGIMPIFALANAGAVLGGDLFAALTHPVALGVAGGLALGKPIGIFAMTLLGARLLRTALPGTATQVLGLGCIAGIGFTMSLFIGALAFTDPSVAAPTRMGVYAGSLLAAIAGLVILAATLPKGRGKLALKEDPTHPFIARDAHH
jgi:Na+:H+ antiporter, NhaA family